MRLVLDVLVVEGVGGLRSRGPGNSPSPVPDTKACDDQMIAT